MPHDQTSPWEDKEYAQYLDHERHMFAWCLIVHGGIPASDARSQAGDFYPFEPPAATSRGLVFHDEAWHWAMLGIFGRQYWQTRPEFEQASADYRAESERYEHFKKQPGT